MQRRKFNKNKPFNFLSKTIIMEINEYIDKMKEIQEQLIQFIDSDDQAEYSFKVLKSFLDTKKIGLVPMDIKAIIYLIQHLSKNHHRKADFYDKMKEFFKNYEKDIKKLFTNDEIFNLFKDDKLILLILFENKIITPNKKIIIFILQKSIEDFEQTPIYNKYAYYFYPEIKPYISKSKADQIANELLNIDSNIFSNFEKKRRIGENDSYIIDLIRNDSVEEFISYINRNSISIDNSKVQRSLFETNSYLFQCENHSLIEYAAFYGSIQIFQYLRLNKVNLTTSLWYYSIHSNSADLIHILEEEHVKSDDGNFVKCFEEAIKCHHNDVANYIQNCLGDSDTMGTLMNAYGFKYFNFSFFPTELNEKIFDYFCKFNYIDIVKSLLNDKKELFQKIKPVLFI